MMILETHGTRRKSAPTVTPETDLFYCSGARLVALPSSAEAQLDFDDFDGFVVRSADAVSRPAPQPRRGVCWIA